MSKKFPDWKTEEEADAWLQSADLTEYDLSDLKPVTFELAPKDAAMSLRLPANLARALKARSKQTNIPVQRLIRAAIEAYLAGDARGSKRRVAKTTVRKPARPAPA